MSRTVSAFAPDGVPEVHAGDDLAALLLTSADHADRTDRADPVKLLDGDIVVVTSKVVSKAEGRVLPGTREQHLDAETARVVARRGATSIVRTRHGLTLAAAGIDASNVERGSAVLLPLDPDASARRLRADLQIRTGSRLAVVVTDTAGRPWREGQTDIAIGAAGLVVAEDYAGRLDAHGNELAVTAPAVADEIAGLAELAQGKLGGRPFAVVRGRADLVLPAADDGPGAAALVRHEGGDLFGWGAREAVVRAVGRVFGDHVPFGHRVPAEELVAVLDGLFGPGAVRVEAPELVICSSPRPEDVRPEDVRTVAFAHGWRVDASTEELRISPLDP